jgi:uncharacterized membrane protein YqiK
MLSATTEALKSQTLETLHRMRDSAIFAMENLATGSKVVAAQGINRSLTYSQANMGDLSQWLSAIQAAIREKESGQPATGPILPEF